MHKGNMSEQVGYVHSYEQEAMFSALLLFYTPGQSVLDAGCGIGALRKYILNEAKTQFKYTGCDIDRDQVLIAKAKWPDINVIESSILDMPEYETYDWVMASGLFNYDKGDNDSNTEFIIQSIEHMLLLAKDGIAFNVMTAFPIGFPTDGLIEISDISIFQYLKDRHYKVIMRSDYLYGDTTFIILK